MSVYSERRKSESVEGVFGTLRQHPEATGGSIILLATGVTEEILERGVTPQETVRTLLIPTVFYVGARILERYFQ